MNRIAATLFAAVLVSLLVASVASAHRGMRGLYHGGSHAPALHHHRAAF